MLQIKKRSKITSFKCNFIFLFRNKKLAKEYVCKKVTPHFITIRAPKNFNIGKHKVYSLNYKTPKLIFKLNKDVMVKSLVTAPQLLLNSLTKSIKTNPTIFVNSVRVTIKSFFKLMWLVVLYFF